MLVYGGIIIVGGQIAWFTGLKSARSMRLLGGRATKVTERIG